jgi:hypothetical protein
VVIADRNGDKAVTAANELNGGGRQVIGLPLDVTDAHSTELFVAQSVAGFLKNFTFCRSREIVASNTELGVKYE